MFRYRDYLTCVLQEGSFSRAAARLHISQPALSAAIKKAEQQYGYPIFDRSSQPVTLTEFGRLYFDSMHQVCSAEEELRDRASNIAALSVGEITIGTNHVYASLLFPELIGLFHRKYPNIRLRLLEGAASANKTQLLNAETDLILDCGSIDAAASALTCVPIGSEFLLLAAPRTLLTSCVPLEQILTAEDICAGKCRDVQCPAISIRQVAAGDFIFLTPGNDTRFREDQLFLEAGLQPNIKIEVEQMATAFLLLEENRMFSFVSETLVQRSAKRPEIAYCKIGSAYTVRDIFFAYAKKRYVRKVISAFIDVARTYLSDAAQ